MSTDTPLDEHAAEALGAALDALVGLTAELDERETPRGPLAPWLNHAASVLDSGTIGDLIAQLVEAKHLCEMARGRRSGLSSEAPVPPN